MRKINLIALLMTLMTAVGMRGQVTTTPPLLQENSSGVVIYYHADQGNKGLINTPANGDIYAHTGVITDKSTSLTDWKYVVANWDTNTPKCKMTYVEPNLWKLEIGDIRTFYGVPAGETVKKLAFVFRNANGSKVGKTSSEGDIFVNVASTGLQVSLTASIDGTLILPGNENVTFTVATTVPADISLKINDEEIASATSQTTLVKAYTFTANGTFTVKATATVSGVTVSDEMTVTYPKASEARQYPGGIPRMGAVRQDDGSVLFCIAAPQKSSAMIVGSWCDYKTLDSNTMYYQDYNGDRYFWIPVSGLDAARQYPYYYIIDGISVGDPYARLVLDPANDKYIPASVYPGLPPYPSDKIAADNVPLAVYQYNINDYNWNVTNFKGVAPQNLIVYELLLRDFTGTEGASDGNGTVRQAMEKIPYLKSLGINAVELLPINEFNGNISWGYNPNFYFAPDKAYGTPDDYKAFIDECHRNGIAVILDMVFNQTDWLHPWYRLYPVGSNPFYNASAPHAYSVLNDWKQEYPLVQQQFEDCLRYWLTEYKVDGFRFDLVKGLGDNASYANNGDAATNAYNASRVARMKRLHAVVREVNPDAYFINENLAGAQEENEMAEDGQLNWANINHQGGQYAMGYSSDSSLKRFYAPDDSRLWGSTVSYLESHDEQRLAYLQNTNGVSGVKGNLGNSMHRLGSAAAQMILSPGAHMIWQFSEMGNFQNTKDATGGNNTDPKKVNWNLLNNANRKGLVDNYTQLIALRNNNPELFDRTTVFTNQVAVANWANGRFLYARNGDKELICVINPNTSGEAVFTATFKEPDTNYYDLLCASYDTAPTFNAVTGKVTVPANCFAVIGSKSVKSVHGVQTDGRTDVTVYGDYGRIVVEGPQSATPEVYNIAGQRFPGLEVPAGMYIVRIGNRAYKVIVR